MATYDLVKRAIRESNPEMIKELYREQLERNRRKCEDVGVYYHEDEHRIRSLLPPDAQVRLFRTTIDGLGETVADIVRSPTSDRVPYFIQSFQFPEAGHAARKAAIESASAYIRTPYTIYPPLLCRSQRNKVIGLEGAGAGRFREASGHATCSVVFVFQVRGPVILIVRDDATHLIEPYLTRIYGLLGVVGPKKLLTESGLIK
jgi:hypothetical protein